MDKRKLREIAPERMYPLAAFQEAAGISPTRMREARLQGLFLKTVNVGQRKYVRGVDCIAYIEKLADLPSPTPTNA
jgi:hypothetical protein